MTYTYKTKGTCSSNIELEVEDGIVKDIAFWGWLQRQFARLVPLGCRDAGERGYLPSGRYTVRWTSHFLPGSAV